MCSCETWLSSNDTNTLPNTGYYTNSQAARKNCNHGGVAILVRDGLNLAAWDCTLPDFDFACGTVLSTDHQILILSVYNPPATSNYRVSSTHLSQCLELYTSKFLHDFPCGIISIFGDFNTPDACWISHSAITASSQAVIDSFDSLNCVQLVTEPTHICGNTLDIFVTNQPELCSVNVEPDHFTSDHYPVTVIFHVSNSESITSDLPNDIPIYSKNTFNIDVFMNSLVIFDYLFHVYFRMIPTDFYLAWYDAMIKSVQTSICLKRKKRSMLPFYLSSHSVHLSNKVSTEKRKLAKFNLLYSTLLSDLKKDLNNSIELDKITLLSSFHSLDTNDCFKLLHKLSGSTPIASVVKLGASCASTDNTKADLFYNFFCSVYKSEKFTYNGCSDNTSINLRELSFGKSDVNSLLKKVPDTTAVAADGILPFVLKYNAVALTPMVFILFSQVVTCCIWPDFWKEAFIMPFQKSGPKSDITNYRGISILPRLSLCLEKLLFNFI